MRQTYYLTEGLETLLTKIEKDFPGAKIHIDRELRFYNFYIPEIEAGMKQYTIRFLPGQIRIPYGEKSHWLLPCFETDPNDPSYKEAVGYIRIPEVSIATVKDFPTKWAKLDGFKTKKEMIKRISEIYKYDIKPDDYLSLYYLDQLLLTKK